jgi:hypothetical protein
MTPYDYPDVSLASVTPITEERLAELLAGQGVAVRQVRGRWWREHARGFLEPVHRLAELSAPEARRPGLCWGYRAALTGDAIDRANAVLPMHLIANVAAHDEAVLPSDARKYHRRQTRRGIRIVHATDLRVFREQGYELMLEWRRRIARRGGAPTREAFMTGLERRTADNGWLNLAALHGDRLLGFSHCYVVDGVAYLEILMVGPDGIAIGLPSRLDFEVIQVLRRTGAASRATSGVHQPEMPGLTAFKARHGFPVVGVPSRFWMAPPLDLWMRLRRPLTYYRLTGRQIERAIAWAHRDPLQPPFEDA